MPNADIKVSDSRPALGISVSVLHRYYRRRVDPDEAMETQDRLNQLGVTMCRTDLTGGRKGMGKEWKGRERKDVKGRDGRKERRD